MDLNFNEKKLEELLGINFKDKELLRLAMTHASFDLSKGNALYGDNERLEFLGDRVLGLVVAAMLFDRFPESKEGDLALRYNALVRKETCTLIAKELNLEEFVLLGPSERKASERRKRAILGNLTEAVIGAVFLDQGYHVAKKFIEQHWLPLLNGIETPMRDAKTELQEWAQGRSLPLPLYKVVERTGPDHSPRFTIEVSVDQHGSNQAEAGSKRRAEQEAARQFLIANNIWEDE